MPRAVVCVGLGDPTLPLGSGVLALDPSWVVCPDGLKAGQIRMGVCAASVNFADPLSVKGEYQVKMPVPFVPGSEASGCVLEVAPGVTAFSPGDRIVAFNQGGMYATECVVHESSAWKVPEGVDLAAAATIPVAYGTADLALRHRANLQPGQTVLILGASGGVGTAAVQISKVLGAQVIGVTQGAEKVAYLRSIGSDAVIDLDDCSTERPLHLLIKQHAPRGVHVVIDPVGGTLTGEALRTVAWGAQLVVIGFAAGGIPKIPANILLVKNTTVHGLYWGSYAQNRPKILRSSMDDILDWLARGALRPHVSHRYPLDQVPLAFETLLSRKAKGKVLIMPQLSSSASQDHRHMTSSKL